MARKILMSALVGKNQLNGLIDGLLLGSAHPWPGWTRHDDLGLRRAVRRPEPDSDKEGAWRLRIHPDRCHYVHESREHVAYQAR
jgi:hypothetical protein